MWPLWLLVMSAQTSRHASSPAGGTRPSITGGGGSCHETDKKAARNCRTVPSNADILPITVVAVRGQGGRRRAPSFPCEGGPRIMRHRSERPEPAGETGGSALPGEDELRRLITQQLADMCGMRPDEVDPDRPLDEHGLSSRDTVALAGYLETLLDRSLPPTLVWEYPTVSHLASALAGPGQQPRPAAHPRLVAHGPSADDAIAVIGLGCRFPGGAAGPIGDPDTFWSFLIDRGDAVGEVPGQRWAAFDDGSPAAGEALASATRWAAGLPHVAGFPAAFFGISPRDAAAMDPPQPILLAVSWEALEHAGIAPVSLRGSRTGVFVGISAAEYAHLTTSDLSRIDAWTATGAATSIAAGRISYLLDLRGPSLAVDTACSSSLLAVH